jgi:hypothetical protein
MKTKWMAAAAVAMSSIVVSGVANAEEKDQSQAEKAESSERTAPVKKAIELTIGTGYMQGLGGVAAGRSSLTDVGQAGAGVQGGVGYRIIPHLSIGAYGSWGMFGHGDSADPSGHVYSSTAGVEASVHILPAGSQLDPWASLGTGWRGYWITGDAGTTTLHGMDVARLQVGVDYRIAKSIAISPVVGATLSSFFTQATPATDEFRRMSDPKVNTFLFAGVQGRFDIPVGSGSSNVASR